LVPNPSFEIHDNCPLTFAFLQNAVPWFTPSLGTTDLFDTCSPSLSDVGVPRNFMGYQNAKTGAAYAGFFIVLSDGRFEVTWREYLEAKLDTQLEAGQKYFVSFYVSLADSFYYATDDIQAYFSSDSLISDTSYGVLPANPQIQNIEGNMLVDKVLWTKISGSFIADGGEQYITIGNFKDDLNTDTIGVSVPPFPNIPTYIYYYIDDVCVSTDSLTCNTIVGIQQAKQDADVSLFPNPFSTQLTFSLADNVQTTVLLYDFLGQQILQQTFTNSTTINTAQLADGIYFYELRGNKGMLKTGKLVKQ
jgi:hypothetical protein